MSSARNSIYSTHSIADAHLLAILDEKADPRCLSTPTSSRFSALLPTKFLETVFILPTATTFRNHNNDDEDGHDGQEAASAFDTMQKSIQVIGLPRPEKSKLRLSHSFETEHVTDNAALDDDDGAEHLHYDSEPQMRYTAPLAPATAPEYTQQGCNGYRYPNYGYGGCRRITYCGYGNRGYAPQRPPQCYFPGGRRQRGYGGGYYYGAGGGGCGRGRGGGCPGYGGVGGCYTQRPVLVRRHGGCCCCC